MNRRLLLLYQLGPPILNDWKQPKTTQVVRWYHQRKFGKRFRVTKLWDQWKRSLFFNTSRMFLHPISCSFALYWTFHVLLPWHMNVIVASGFTSNRFHVILKNECCRQIVFEFFMCHDYQTCIYWLGKDQDQTHLFKFPKTCNLKRSWREAKEDEHHLLMQAVWNTNSLANLFPGLPRPTRAFLGVPGQFECQHSLLGQSCFLLTCP